MNILSRRLVFYIFFITLIVFVVLIFLYLSNTASINQIFRTIFRKVPGGEISVVLDSHSISTESSYPGYRLVINNQQELFGFLKDREFFEVDLVFPGGERDQGPKRAKVDKLIFELTNQPQDRLTIKGSGGETIVGNVGLFLEDGDTARIKIYLHPDFIASTSTGKSGPSGTWSANLFALRGIYSLSNEEKLEVSQRMDKVQDYLGSLKEENYPLTVIR